MPLLNEDNTPGPVSKSGSMPKPGSMEEILRRAVEREAPGARTILPAGGKKGLFENCTNPECRSGWLQLWRSRHQPVFEGGWTCSPECMAARVSTAVVREMKGRPTEAAESRAPHRHRIPLGLLMMEQGWITASQLRGALESQRKHGTGRLGSWLVKQQGVSEAQVTRALGLQWSCPVLHIGPRHEPARMAPLVPRLFIDAFGALPLRLAAGRLLYLAFEDRLDPVLALALERMTGLKVESGVVAASEFTSAQEQMLAARYPETELVEAASAQAAARVLARSIERVKPAWSRLVRVHEFLWLRMGKRAAEADVPAMAAVDSVEDTICTVAGA